MEETDIRTPLEREVSEHPAAEALDLLKLIYQNEFGCGHLICDPKENLRRLLAEVEELPKDQGEVRVQPIGNGLCRLPLSLLHRSGLRAETVQKLFLLTAEQPRGSREGFLQKVSELQVWLEDRDGPVRPEEVSAALRRWQLEGESPFRHSAGYRRLYAPAYRVLEERYCAFLPLFGAIDARLRRGEPFRVAIDGNCAAGKSTLAALLNRVYGCPVIPMDHFFLRPDQRTPERLAEPGGNVDYERFAQEVLRPLLKTGRACYRPYDCGTRMLADPVEVPPAPFWVVEGSYSLHPTLRDGYDLKVFLSVEPEEQLRRIERRNGPAMLERFRHEWIPMEERYFSTYAVRSGCTLHFPEDRELPPDHWEG